MKHRFFIVSILCITAVLLAGCGGDGGIPPGSTPKTISTPSTPSGPSQGNINEVLTYSTGGSNSSLEHNVQYRFDWGDGNYSAWLSSTNASHSWSSSGNYMVQAQARSSANPSIVSSWSGSKSVTIKELSIPLNVRIDYIGVKNAMGRDDYGEDHLYGEIQLVIVITDEKNESQTHYIPQESSKGLEGWTIGDYSVKGINRSIYYTASAGDYLKLSMVAYDIDSKTKLITDAAILELLGRIAGVPEASIFKEIVSLLPVDDDLVGEYEATGYPDQKYGIGQHVATCLDKFANENFFVWFSIWSDEEPPLLPERPTIPGVPEFQTLKYTMPSNIVVGSYVKYRKPLQTGEKVRGSVQLTGYKPDVDWDSTCCFWVYDPDGNEVNKWCEDFKEDGLRHEFSFTTSCDGEYTIKVGHCSYYPRELHIEVSPYGWD